MKTLLITKELGGQASLAPKVENYPGYPEISGMELIQKFYEQAKKSGCEFLFDEVESIKEKKDGYEVETHSKTIETKTIILAYGKTPRELKVPGEEKFKGRGVSYCAVCDGPLYMNKTVAVVGGGNSAFDAAIYLSSLAEKVYLIHRRKEFRAFEHLVEEARKIENLEFILNSVVKEIKGDEIVRSIVIENVETKESKELGVNGIFIEIGYEIKTDLIKDFVKLDENNQIIINNKCETFYPDKEEKRPGVFAAGDITNTPFKQIIIAAGQGAIAALQAYNYLHEEKQVTTDFSYRG